MCAANINTNLAGWSTTAGSNQPDSTDLASTLREDLQAIQAAVRYLRTSGTIASASTTDLATKSEEILSVSGTTTITALGTVSAGMVKVLVFEGALVLTHNGTSLILPTAANITTAAGDVATMLSLGSGNWRCIGYQRANGYTAAVGWEKLGEQAASTSSGITFTGMDSAKYKEYRLVLSNITLSADAYIAIQFGDGSIDTSAVYSTQVLQAASTTVSASLSIAQTSIFLWGTMESSGGVSSTTVNIHHTTSVSTGARVTATSYFQTAGGGQITLETIAGAYAGGAVSRVSASPSTGTFTGTLALYGLR